MILNIKFSNNVSVTFPVERMLNSNRLLLSSFPDASLQLKSGLACTLYSKNGKGYEPVSHGKIRSVEESNQGIIVDV